MLLPGIRCTPRPRQRQQMMPQGNIPEESGVIRPAVCLRAVPFPALEPGGVTSGAAPWSARRFTAVPEKYG